jgi:hypothetical protein
MVLFGGEVNNMDRIVQFSSAVAILLAWVNQQASRASTISLPTSAFFVEPARFDLRFEAQPDRPMFTTMTFLCGWTTGTDNLARRERQRRRFAFRG